jgi:hypothetical protein
MSHFTTAGTERKDSRWFTWVAGAIAVVFVTSLLVGLQLAPPSSASSGGTPAAAGPSTIDHLYLTIAFNPSTGMDEYFPGNFTVPAHTEVAVQITSYDNGTNPVPLANSAVVGTIGNVATFTNTSTGKSTTQSNWPAGSVTHTFTVLSRTGAGSTFSLNVPVPPATNLGAPAVVTFETYFNETGFFTWMCFAPCDQGAMATPGYMTGTLSVE